MSAELALIGPILAAMLAAATPLLFAALGELVVEKSGVLNLGVEGMMLVGAVCGFAVAEKNRHVLLRALSRGGGKGSRRRHRWSAYTSLNTT
ncbi:ABC transporter permease subunit [Azospirillum argentinense]|uniref:ABC transporter permease subunit n=1 Tax=Azospirillum argentinense TaxID=2970906 RepID=UPI003FD79D12